MDGTEIKEKAHPFYSWIGAALGDGENPSSGRLIGVPTLLAVYLVPLAVWTVLSIKDGKMNEIPGSLLGFIGTVSGPLLAFLHANKREEMKPAQS